MSNQKPTKKLRSFGLNAFGNASVMVEQENYLVLENTSEETVSLKMSVKEANRSVFEKKGEYKKFTMENTTNKSISLIIPTVVNPNLSPLSKSGVDLKIGQEILFRANGKKLVLLTVDDSIVDGEVLNVALIIQKRKKKLGALIKKSDTSV